mgnify:FL=1
MEDERDENEEAFVVDINLGPQFEEVEAQLQRISYFQEIQNNHLENISNALVNFVNTLKKHEKT